MRELLQQPKIVVIKQTDVLHLILEECYPIDADAERPAGVAFGVVTDLFEERRVDHPASEDLEPAGLLAHGATVTFAHWALKKGNRSALCWWLAATVLLGIIFVYLQVAEYGHAYHELDLTLKSGVYGSTFFMLTGFHGFHVTMGATMLAVILVRSMLGHFSEHNHFAFEAVAWYWHFVDVVWLGLFVFVYWV